MRISQFMTGLFSQLLLRDFSFFLATDEACLPSAVRTDFGKCAIVRFLFAADAAFLMFFFAAFLCFVEAIFVDTPMISVRPDNLMYLPLK